MSEVLIFGGTTEGRLLAEFCATKGIRAAVSVTTDYGAELLPRSDFIRELVGNLDSTQMSYSKRTISPLLLTQRTHSRKKSQRTSKPLVTRLDCVISD